MRAALGPGRIGVGLPTCASIIPPSRSSYRTMSTPSRTPRRGSPHGPDRGVRAGLSMATVIDALQAMRGISPLAAVTLVAEVGDFRRFANPRQLMAYVGLVPSESSSGGRMRRGGITKASNHHARRVLIEGAWTYRFAARLSRGLHARNAEQPKEVRAIAWKAQLPCAADTGVSPPAASPRSWSPSRWSPARWSGSSGRSPVGCNHNRPHEPTTPAGKGDRNTSTDNSPVAIGRRRAAVGTLRLVMSRSAIDARR